MNTALGTKKAGMVLLNTTSFSAVASQAVTPVFSATYKNYVVYLNITANSVINKAIYLKMRAGATDSSASYTYAGPTVSSTGTSTYIAGNNVTSGFLISNGDGATNQEILEKAEFFLPFDADHTGISFQGSYIGSTNDFFSMGNVGLHKVATSYDGFNIIASAGTITGTAYVYGVSV
jgi:hypothetical protein